MIPAAFCIRSFDKRKEFQNEIKEVSLGDKMDRDVHFRAPAVCFSHTELQLSAFG